MAAIEPLLPPAGKVESPRRIDLREVMNAIRYLVRSGCEWRMLVERTFGWMIRCRRLVRDYEARLDVSEAMAHVAMGGLFDRARARRFRAGEPGHSAGWAALVS